MHLFVVLTSSCNLKCLYCYGKCCDDIGSSFDFEVDYSIPDEISYDIDVLKSFCSKAKLGNLIFYGGEPLLKMDKMMEIMEKVDAEKFMLQTNGLLLSRLDPAYLKRLHTILVSIDGDEALTDFYRGNGVYRRVIENIKSIREKGFKGEIVARMTISQQSDLERNVNHLLSLNNLFDSIHWQIDAQFWQNDFNQKAFTEWVEESYGPGLLHLIYKWAEQILKGKVLRIYPFLGVMETLLHGGEAGLRCGSGWSQYTVQTDGTIVPCPSMVGLKAYYLGNIKSTDPSTLPKKVELKAPCSSCDILPICGGRCLYANITKLWGDEGFRLVCSTVRLLVEGLKCVKPIVEKALKNKLIHPEDLAYTKFNSCEIIP
ncbi:MAG: TIGR04084 family radical SAM/SPASM domain-containing protein [Nitrososphaerales archaeon]